MFYTEERPINLFINVIFLFERIEFLTTNGWKRLQKYILTRTHNQCFGQIYQIYHFFCWKFSFFYNLKDLCIAYACFRHEPHSLIKPEISISDSTYLIIPFSQIKNIKKHGFSQINTHYYT